MKTEIKMQKGKPSFKESNDIWPQAEGQSTKGKIDTSLFGPSALTSGFTPDGKYSKKGKGGTVDKGVVKVKANSISPTADY